MKRPYVSGPIAGAPHTSFEEKMERFSRAELVLRNSGYEPVNPLAVQACETQDCNPEAVGRNRLRSDGQYRHLWSCWLKHDLIAMLQEADGIAMLPDWESSKGATLEREVAVSLGWEVIDLTKDMVVLGLPHELERARSGRYKLGRHTDRGGDHS